MRKSIILIIFGIFLAGNSLAGAADNVTGWAWSKMDDPATAAVDEGQIGWISFNSSNCDTDNNGFSNGGVGCPAAGTVIASYGVSINANGTFTGYAWSESVGWISFAPLGSYPVTAPNYPWAACLDFPGAGQACDGVGNYTISGWARVCSVFASGCSGALRPDSERGGWEGWIKLRGTNYGLSVNNITGDFSGYAYSDSVLGWIGFSGVNYKVKTNLSFNSPPLKPGTFEVNWNECSIRGGVQPTFSWTYSDPDNVPAGTDPQTAYEIEVQQYNADFNPPKFNHLVTGPAGGSTSYNLDLHDDDEDPDQLPTTMQDYQLDWNTRYWWRVRVKDSFGNWSDWSTPKQSETPDYPSPWVEFTWQPPDPSKGETVEFKDNTETFGETHIDFWVWTIISGTGVFVDGTDNTTSSPHIQFSTLNNTVRLQVTDSGGQSCHEDRDVIVQLPLPDYKEIPPSSWFKKIFNGLVAFLRIF